MKASRLQLWIITSLVLIIQVTFSLGLSSQSLIVNCPDPDTIYLDCIGDLPINSGDSLDFVSLAGASVADVTGALSIVYNEMTSQGSGCTLDTIFVDRSFEISDESNAEPTICDILYAISKPADGTVVTCSDITVYLDESGNASIDLADVDYTITTTCGDAIQLEELDLYDFSCVEAGTQVPNILSVVDACDVTVSCNFFVAVIENLPPDITCSDDINIDLEACECEAIVNFPDPIVEDNCSIVEDITVNRTDMSGLYSGDVFPVGTTTISYQAVDQIGNVSTCSFDVIIESDDPGTISSQGDQNISLNQDCEAIVSPAMIVKDPKCDLESYEVTLFDEANNQLPSTTITSEYLGAKIRARATYGCYDNYTEVILTVEDKMPPMIDCNDVTVSCGEAITFPLPQASDNCGNVSVVLLNEVIDDVACDDPNIDKIVTKTYGVINEHGDIIQTCDQNLYVEKFDIEDVDSPEQNVSIYCGSGYDTDINGNPDPSETGAPSLDGVELWPLRDVFCNVSLSYIDTPIQGSSCFVQIAREWTVLNWYCGQDGMENYIQYIALIDTVGPEIVCPSNVTISSAAMSCETIYSIPPISFNDACQDEVEVDIVYPGGFADNTNGLEVELPLGENEITYRVTDICGQQTTCSYMVYVQDDVQPVAICESGLGFGLDGNGFAVLLATTFDNGSLDECELATIEIARMDDACGVQGNTEFGSSITLCCDDIGTEVMVILKVTDASGNFNQCMSAISVYDNTIPVFLSELPDITIGNDYLYDPENLDVFGTVEQNVDQPSPIILDSEILVFDGNATNALVFDNCEVAIISDTASFSLDMCGIGTIDRTITVADNYGNETFLEQEINIVLALPFTEDDITWPDDITIYNECPPNLDPEDLGSFPEYSDVFNSRVSYTMKDDTIGFLSRSCYQIERKWFVSDWCNRVDGGSFIVFKDTQHIDIIDNIAPTITSACQDSTICSYVINCGPHPISISAEGIDNCVDVGELEWTLEIDFGADNSVDLISNGNTFTGELPLGDNTITWILNDGCGNTDECSYNFSIESCVGPQPFCLAGQEFYINPIDTSGDMMADLDGVRITPDLIDGGSNHPCGKDISLSFSADVNDTVRIFECPDLGMVPIMLWATDSDGNSDFCNVFIEIQDTATVPVCGMATIGGVIFGNDIDFVSGVGVSLGGTDIVSFSDENGFFGFPEMEMGGSYQVIPNKNDIARNGVSTSDLVLIQKHILGIKEFESPYKMIAADVNQSKEITAADLISVRKLILGKTQEFANGKTWAFIPGDFVFLDPDLPWATEVPEKYEIQKLSQSMDIDFIGVKLGDVNSTVEINSSIDATKRSSHLITVRKIEDDDYKIEFLATESIYFAGIYFEVDISNFTSEISEIRTSSNSWMTDYHITESGILRILMTDTKDNFHRKGDRIFEIIFSENIYERDIEDLIFDEASAELVDENGGVSKLGFRFDKTAKQMILLQNTPNPWTDFTSFEVYMPSSEVSELTITDVSGRTILKKKVRMNAGSNIIKIENSDLPVTGGLYFYEINSSYGVQSKKMMLLSR